MPASNPHAYCPQAIHRVTSGECDGKMLGSHARQGWFHATP